MVRSSSTLGEVWVLRPLVVAMTLFLAMSTFAQNNLANQAEIDEAKAVAAKALTTFGKTLDLRSVHRDLYVASPTMRRAIMRSGLYEADVDPKVVDGLSQSMLERSYLASENLSWLMWTYGFQEDKETRFEDFIAAARPRIWPKLNKGQKNLFQRAWKSPDDGSIVEKITKSQLPDWISLTEILAAELRRAIPADLRQRFSSKVDIECYPQAAGDVLGLKDAKTFYVSAVVKGIWGKYTFSIVRERGSMRIYGFIIHDGPG